MRKILPETLLEFKMVSNPRYSPNGKTAAFVVYTADTEINGYKGDIWLLKDGAPVRLTSGGDGKSYCWTPDNKILFSALRDPEHKKLAEKAEIFTDFYEIGTCGGEARMVFTLPYRAGGLTHLAGDLYAFTATVNLYAPDVEGMNEADREKTLKDFRDPAYNTFDEIPFWFNGRGLINRLRTQLYIYNRATGECTLVSDPNWNVSYNHYRDGKILYVGAPAGDNRVPRSGVYEYDIETRETRELIKWGTMKVSTVKYFGDEILLIASECKNYGTNESPVFYLMDPKTCQYRLFNAYDRGIGHGGIASDARYGSGQGMKLTSDGLYFISVVGFKSVLKLLTFEGEVKDIDFDIDAMDAFDIYDGKVLHCSYKGDNIAELFIGNEKVTHFNDELFADLDIRTPVHHPFIASDGFEIDGWFMTPSGYEPGKKYPAILHVHGGPRSLFGSIFHHEQQMWANAGYFVFFCNPRGSDGKGDAFADVWGKYGSIDYQNLMDFADEMLRICPDVDVDNFGVTGGSYGGFMTNWIIGHTNRFKAACAQRSIANWTAFEYTSDIGPGFTMSQHRTTTVENAEGLWDISPLKYAHLATTPTLFIQSDEDYRCWLVDALSMFTALKMHGVDSKVCLFKGENHELSRGGKPRNRLSRMDEIVGWMNKYCK